MTSPWIDVTKGLPPFDVDVLGLLECPRCYLRHVSIVTYDDIIGWDDELHKPTPGWDLNEYSYCPCTDSSKYVVTHWMTIPELPKKKENNGTL